MKKIASLFLVLLLGLLCACGTKPQLVEEPPTPEPIVVKDQNYNPLTGEYNLKDAAVGKRPVSVMISNIKKALPQRGISQIDVAYEILVEGGITRIMGVFADYQSMPQVGPVRSVRHYYPECSLPINTIFVHWGGSKQGYNAIKTKGVDHIDGMVYSKTAFITDQTLKAQKGQEHSNFVYAEGVQAAIEKLQLDPQGTYASPFAFAAKGESATLNSGNATKAVVPFSQYCTAEFLYDAQTGLYAKSQFGQPHVDAISGEQVKVKNVFVLFAPVSIIDAPSGLLDISLKSGTGYYVSDGKYQVLNWTKASSTAPFVFTDELGQTVTVNPGKSWVCILNKTSKDQIRLLDLSTQEHLESAQ